LLPGSEFAALGGNVDPTFSPDGESVLFRATNDLLRIPVSGGKPQRVDSAGAASWADGGRIVLARADTLWEISIERGARRVISAPDRAAGIPRLDWPAVLAGGRFALVNVGRQGTPLEEHHIGLISLDDGHIEDLGIVGTNPLYSGTGHIVFGRVGGDVFAVPFSLRARKVQGQPRLILQGIWVGGGEPFGWRVSPDGQRVAVEYNDYARSRPKGPIVLLDFRTGAVQQVAAQGEGLSPQWRGSTALPRGLHAGV